MTIQINTKSNEILIFGEIRSNSAATFDKDLKALGNPKNLTIRINSPGGDVFQGSAIYQMLARHGADKTAIIEGVAASMASLIAMAGDRILIAENAMLMIHNPAGVAAGGRAAMDRMSDLLKGIGQQMASTYSKRTKIPLAKIETMMDDESWFTADEAVKAGFADAIEGEMKAAAKREMSAFDMSAFKHAPKPQSIGEFATAYWGNRQKSAEDISAQSHVEGAPEHESFGGSVAPDLVTASLNPSEIFGAWNALSSKAKVQRGFVK